MNTNSGNLENSIEYYHLQFGEIFQLIKEGKPGKITKERREELKKLVEEYKSNFQDDPKYESCWPPFMKCLGLI